MNLLSTVKRCFLFSLLTFFVFSSTLHAADNASKVVGPSIKVEDLPEEEKIEPLKSSHTSFRNQSFGKNIEQTDRFEASEKKSKRSTSSHPSTDQGSMNFEEYARENGFEAVTNPGLGGKTKKNVPVYRTVKKKAFYHEFKPNSLDSSWELSTGYRRDDLRWSIAGDISGTDPDILSELTWDNIDIYQIQTQNRWVLNDLYVVKGSLAYGWIVGGESKDSDYDGDGRTNENSRSVSDTEGDEAVDASLGFGYKLKPHSRVSITPMIGYSYHELNLRDKNGVQEFGGQLGPFSGLNSTYEVNWQGPWIGADISYRLGRGWTFFTGWEYHVGDYRAEGNHSLRTDLAHPTSYAHDSEMEGVTGEIGLNYALNNHWSVHLKSDLSWWETERGTDDTYFVSGSTSQTRLNRVEWDSASLMLGATYHFDPVYSEVDEDVEELVNSDSFQSVRMWGRYRLSMGVDMEESEGIFNDANANLNMHTLQGPQSDYIFGEAQNNTYDPAIYDQYLLNIELTLKERWMVYAQLVADPWSWVGTTGDQTTINNQDPAVTLNYNLKYFGAFNSTIREVYRNHIGDRVAFPYIKVHDGHLTRGTVVQGMDGYDGVENDGRGLSFNIPELDIDYEFRPFRKAWVDYTQDDWHLRLFALADQEQALTSDDPLQLSNHKDYWQQSPWLYQYEPAQFFTDGSIKRGYYSDALSYNARDSEGNRLVLLRGVSVEGMKDDTYFSATVAAPFTPWDEKYFAADNVPGAIRVKQRVNDKTMIGSTYTFRAGMIDSSVADFGQVLGFDGKYDLNENTELVAEVAGSHREMDLLTNEAIATSNDGFAYKAEIRSEFDHKHDGQTKWNLSYAQMDRNFEPILSQYLNTRDDRFWGTHISFDDHPDLDPFKLGDGLDVNRRVVRFNWKEKLFKDRFYNEFDIRTVHQVDQTNYVDLTIGRGVWSVRDTRYVETVTRDEMTLKITPRLTAKGLFRWRALPKSMKGIDPIFTAFYFPKDDIDLYDFYVANSDVNQGRDPDQFTYSGGLQYVLNPEVTLEGIVERTNAIPDFPRGILNEFYRNPVERVDGILEDRMQNFMYFQGGGALKAAPPYPYYNIFKQRVIYRPESRLTYTLHATQNGYKAAGGIDDNINHVGIGAEFKQNKKINWFMDYTYSMQIDLPHYVATSKREEMYSGHHNVYASCDYHLNLATILRAEYGVFGLGGSGVVGNPYNVGSFSLPTIDTEHLLRVSLTGDF